MTDSAVPIDLVPINPSRPPSDAPTRCRHCGINVSDDPPLHPCRCDAPIHPHCLRVVRDTVDAWKCPQCNTTYRWEISQPLLRQGREVAELLFIVFLMLLAYCAIVAVLMLFYSALQSQRMADELGGDWWPAALGWAGITLVGLVALLAVTYAWRYSPWTVQSSTIQERWALAILRAGALLVWAVLSPVYFAIWMPARQVWGEIKEDQWVNWRDTRVLEFIIND